MPAESTGSLKAGEVWNRYSQVEQPSVLVFAGQLPPDTKIKLEGAVPFPLGRGDLKPPPAHPREYKRAPTPQSLSWEAAIAHLTHAIFSCIAHGTLGLLVVTALGTFLFGKWVACQKRKDRTTNGMLVHTHAEWKLGSL